MIASLSNPLALALIVAGYLAGSISAAVVTCKILGLPDPRRGGSGNPGATNVLRLGGKKAALITLAGDVFKGVVPVMLARIAGGDSWVVATTALAAFLGHLYPVFFAFKGGKGVATAFGVISAAQPLVGGCMVALWLGVVLITRYSSLAALTAAALAPLLVWTLSGELSMVGGSALMAVLLFWRHRANITRLLNGQEDRIRLRRS